MNEPGTTTIDINGFATRVWRKGKGPRIGFLAGYGGLPRWVPFLDRLAETRTVIVPSLPGFPGGEAAQFWWVAGVMVVLSVTMLWLFRRLRWL